MMGSELQHSDIKFVESLSNTSSNVVVYSSREQHMREDRQYGYEAQNMYTRMSKDFYTLNSKVKLVRAFEQMWQICNNISDKNFIYTVSKTNWLL